MLKYILLGLLNYQPMTGYELEGWINVSAGNFWSAKLSQIYTTLKTLEQDGLVISHVEPQEGRPDRRVYQITGAGQNDLHKWLLEPITEVDTKKDSLLVKVFFYPPHEREKLLAQLHLQLALHQQKLAQYQQEAPDAIQEMLTQQPVLAPNALFWEATRQFGEMYEEMYIRWLEQTIQLFETKLPNIRSE